MSQDPTQPMSTGWPAQPPAARYSAVRRRRKRWPYVTGIVVLAVVILLVVVDRVANAVAENQMASQFQSSLALSGKPNVSIEGFPFLTQLAAKDFNQVDISASNETTGPLEIASLTATLHGMHFTSFSSKSATVDDLNATGLVTFTALGKAGGIPEGITLSYGGADQVKASVDIGPISDSATAVVKQSGSNRINVHITDAGGIPTELLGNLADFSITLPKLPAGLSIQNVSVTQQGVRITITGHNATLSQ